MSKVIVEDIPVISVSMANAIYQGPQGEKGDKGDRGLIGITGPRGPQGEKGDTGNSGVYVGSSEPTDLEVLVWIDPTGEGSISGFATQEYVDEAIKKISLTPGPAGPKGDAPVKGIDYWTDADKTAIINDVIAALPVYDGSVR